MQRWVVIFKDSEEMLAIRSNQELRDKHVEYAKSHPQLLIGGGLKNNPDSSFCGAMWVVEATARADVESLIFNDPFFVAEHRTYEIYTWGKILEDQKVEL